MEVLDVGCDEDGRVVMSMVRDEQVGILGRPPLPLLLGPSLRSVSPDGFFKLLPVKPRHKLIQPRHLFLGILVKKAARLIS